MSEPAPWTNIFNRVKTTIPSCIDAVIRQEMFAVAIDFTGRTNIWVEEIPVTVPANAHQVTFAVTGGMANRLMSVYSPNDPVRRRWVSGGLTMRIPGIIEIYQSSPEDRDWVVAVAKQCQDEAMAGTPPVGTGYPVIDDWIVDLNNDALYYGTLSFLYRMPAKPYSNEKTAAAAGAKYSSMASQVFVENMRTNVYGGQAWQFPQSFATTARKGIT